VEGAEALDKMPASSDPYPPERAHDIKERNASRYVCSHLL
jgi:hypothetical protein